MVFFLLVKEMYAHYGEFKKYRKVEGGKKKTLFMVLPARDNHCEYLDRFPSRLGSPVGFYVYSSKTYPSG